MIEIVLEIGRAVNIVMTKCLIAVGDVLTPTTVGITFQWVVAAAGSWLLGSKLGWGLEGVWIAMAADDACADSFTRCILRKNVGRRILRA